MTFSDLALISPLVQAVTRLGYTAPSPIQERAIPPVLAGRDLLGCAQTGTGKTAAFALPILQRLAAQTPKGRRPIRALVLTPTRELALQIHDSFTAYGQALALRCAVIFGGVGQAPQVAALAAGVDVLTATPGRLNDLIGQGYVDLSGLEIFVLDEADRMLDMGFIHDVKKVLAHLPRRRQTLLFSATMPREIEALAAGILHNPVRVMVSPPATTVERIDQSVCLVAKADKKRLLAHLLTSLPVDSALVFTRTKHGADRVVRELARAGITAMAIHGNKSQSARQKALGAFKDGSLKVLVATDIAARGIDVSGLSHVFNYDLPNVPETYVHRIGRTGRAGHDGVAISFCCAEEEPYLRDIQALTHQKIPVRSHPWALVAQDGAPPAQPSKETMNMEQTTKAPAAPGAVGQSPEGEGAQAAAHKRRRHRGGRGRRGRGTGEGQPAQAQASAGQSGQGAQSGQQAASAQSGQSAPRPRRERSAQAPAAQKQPAQAPQPAKAAQPKAGAPKAPKAPSPRKEEPAAQSRTQHTVHSLQPRRTERQKAQRASIRAEFSAEDNSIQLISRRPPAVKFANFEEYMKAHTVGTGKPEDSDGQA